MLRWAAGLLSLVLLPILVGCGTNLEEVLYQTATAAARTCLDNILTDVANEVSARYDEDDTVPADEEDGADGGNGGATDGAGFYATNCASCHGDDEASGFAPDVSGMTAAQLAAGLESGTHGSITLTDEEIEAIADFLGGGGGTDGGGTDGGTDGSGTDGSGTDGSGTDGGGTDGGGTDDGGTDDGGTDTDTGGGAGDGPELYSSNCAACHGDDGASGFAPGISGFTTDQLLAGLESGSHGGITLTDDEVTAIADFLGA